MPTGVAYYAMIAGGCFRAFYDGTVVKDYDLFFNSHDDWKAAVTSFRDDEKFTETTKPGEDMYPSFVDDGGIPFNLIGFRFHKTLMDLAGSFDFRCCAIAAWLASEEAVVVYAAPGAEQDASEKVLNFLNHQHIDRVIRRMDRYVDQYGYRRSEQFEEGLIVCRGMPVDSSAGNY